MIPATCRQPMTVAVSEQEYRNAGLRVARRMGRLRICPWLMFGGLLIMAGALYLLNAVTNDPVTVLIPVTPFVLGLVLLLIGTVLLPREEKRRLSRDYMAFQTVQLPATVTLETEEILTQSARFTVHDPYGVILLCIETTTAFVFVKDSERFSVLPKEAVPAENRDEIFSFLRLQFTRKYALMKRWMF